MFDTHFLSLSLSLSLSLLVALPGFSQITIDHNGHTAIGTDLTENNKKLKVRCPDCNQSTNYAIHSELATTSSSFSYGVYGSALQAWYSVGVRGHAEGTTITRGVVGSASGGSSHIFGGYFTQGIYVSGGITQASDERLKTDIIDLSSESVVEKVSQLRPVRYRYLSAEELRSRGLPASHAEEGEHVGLLAQEVENIFPELVSEVAHILNEREAQELGAEAEIGTTKAIDYQGLIVALIAAMQDQQETIEQLEVRIEAIEAAVQGN